MQSSELHKLFRKSNGVSTDSRKIKEGNIFFALKGPSFNGNEFALKALDMGASYSVVDEPTPGEDDRLIHVENSLEALQDLANFHRRQFKGPVIGLTGSNGKTTTKELIHAVLSTKFNTVATVGNLNNHIGVPLSLLEIKDDTDIAIIEMGANHVGEIANLCRFAEPSHGLITNIGKAHIGTFGGFENIIRGKSELFDFLIKTDGIIWLNMEDPVLSNMKKRIRSPRLYPEGDSGTTRLISADPYIVYSDDSGATIETQLIGQYNFINIAAAKAVGQEFGIPDEEANLAISRYQPENMRSEIIKKAGKTIVMDAYNANPTSMSAAIDNFVKMKGQRKLMILGDMYELGEAEETEHRELGKLAGRSGIESWFVGGLTKVSADESNDHKWFGDKDELKSYFIDNVSHFDTILLKGSRGIQLEQVLDWIK